MRNILGLMMLSFATLALAQEASVSADDAANGQKIYDKYCGLCHNEGVLGAPKFRDTAVWQPLLESKKIEGLVKSSISGLNSMPAKGACTECSEADIKAAIIYMLPQS